MASEPVVDVTVAPSAGSVSVQGHAPAVVAAEAATPATGGDDAWREDVVRLSRRERRLRKQDEAREARMRAALEKAYDAATGGDVAAAVVAVEEAQEVAPVARRAAVQAIPRDADVLATLAAIGAVLEDIQQRRGLVFRDDNDLAVILSVF